MARRERAGITIPADIPGWLKTWDIILHNSSAGKDSLASLDYLVEQADLAEVRDRIIVVHADLGRCDWRGTRDLAERQARSYGLRFEVVRRKNDLLYQVEFERKKWPSNSCRYCTSDHKTSQVLKLMTQLVQELRDRWLVAIGPDLAKARIPFRAARILNVLGLRAEESPVRAKLPPLYMDDASNTKRYVERWLPIHDWKIEQVWERILSRGLEYHPAYDPPINMPRLSCALCIFASRSALLMGAKHNQELAQEYARIEQAIDFKFRKELAISDVLKAAQTEEVSAVEEWKA